VFLNVLFGTGDRLLQRLMLAKDQSPVDISKSGTTLLNNLLGLAPLLLAAWLKGELSQAPAMLAHLDRAGYFSLFASFVVGVGISYCGIWAQSLISATSFLVLVNANKFVIIFLEVFLIHTKVIHGIQLFGAMVTIVAGVAYGKAREAQEEEEEAKRKKEELEKEQDEVSDDDDIAETQPLMAKNV